MVKRIRIISWNVNGIRAIYKKGLIEFLEREKPDIFCVQETKAHKEQVEPMIINPLDYESHWISAKRKGYSGVATFTKPSAHLEKVNFGLGMEDYDNEGRVLITEHPDFDIYNIYFPNGGSGKTRHDFKQKFLKDLNNHLIERRKANDKPIIVLGDYNVAREGIDVHDPEGLTKTSGFLPEEREWFKEFLKIGFVDIFRKLYPDEREVYSWWDYRTRARMANRGWRIDYICITEDLVDKVTQADVFDDIEGSDHCPVMLEINVSQ